MSDTEDKFQQLNETNRRDEIIEVLEWCAENVDSFDEVVEKSRFSSRLLRDWVLEYDIDNDWLLGEPDKIETERQTDVDIVNLSDELPTEIDDVSRKQGIYVLECEEGKYYVGASRDLHRRLTQHFSGEGAEWTKRYEPIEIHQTYIFDDCDWHELEEREDEITLDVMEKFGWKNVRGGNWFSPHLSSPPEKIRERDRPQNGTIENLSHIAQSL